MPSQDVIFVSVGDADYDVLEPELRRSIYFLRDYSFRKNIPVRIAFCSLQNKDEMPLMFNDLDVFAFKSGSDYFASYGKVGLYDYLDVHEKGPLPLLVYLGGGKNEVTEKASSVAVPEDEYKNLPHKIEKALKRPSPKKRKALLWTLVGILLLLAVLCAAGAVYSSGKKRTVNAGGYERWVKPEFEYGRVYTGDGDRLIMRVDATESSTEIIRLHEYEVVKCISTAGDWMEIEYHGLHGYVHSEWLQPAVEDDYVITDAHTRYEYGKAVMEQGDMKQGLSFIQKAADSGLLEAKWDLYRVHMEPRSEEALDILKDIVSLKENYEEKLGDYYELSARVQTSSGNKEAAEKFQALSDRRRASSREQRIRAAKTLSEYYRDTDAATADYYYKIAQDLGLEQNDGYSGR